MYTAKNSDQCLRFHPMLSLPPMGEAKAVGWHTKHLVQLPRDRGEKLQATNINILGQAFHWLATNSSEVAHWSIRGMCYLTRPQYTNNYSIVRTHIFASLTHKKVLEKSDLQLREHTKCTLSPIHERKLVKDARHGLKSSRNDVHI